MLLKLAIFALIIGVIYLRFFYKPKKRRRPSSEPPPEIMVECAACGTFIAGRESVIRDGIYYCCKECANIEHKRGEK